MNFLFIHLPMVNIDNKLSYPGTAIKKIWHVYGSSQRLHMLFMMPLVMLRAFTGSETPSAISAIVLHPSNDYETIMVIHSTVLYAAS